MIITKERAGQIALATLLPRAKLSEAEVARRFEQAVSPAYWQQLNPQLTVNGEGSPEIENQAIGECEREQLLKMVARSGYFQTEPLIDPGVIDRMRDGVETLRRGGWPEVFAFAYDEFWQVTRTPSLVSLLSGALGRGYKPLPHVVVHYVPSGAGSGWRPHVDFSERTDRFTVWLGLNDAMLDGGCMYLIPKHRLSDSTLRNFISTQPLTHTEVLELLHGSRALPIRAGTVLGWEHDVIHWGTSSSAEAPSRISLSVVFLREGFSPLNDEVPLLDALQVPDFSQRLFAVAKALTYYNIHVLSLNQFKKLASLLVAEFREPAINT